MTSSLSHDIDGGVNEIAWTGLQAIEGASCPPALLWVLGGVGALESCLLGRESHPSSQEHAARQGKRRMLEALAKVADDLHQIFFFPANLQAQQLLRPPLQIPHNPML